jgi:hypothetical protein
MLGSKLLSGAAIVVVSMAVAGAATAKEQFKTFDPKGSTYTFSAGINDSGAVAGYYMDSAGVGHGFLRTSDGAITSFDPKGAIYTEATGINDKGEVSGWYRDKSGTFYSFVRTADGMITKFNPTQGYEPEAIGLNAKGKVTGWYSMGGNGSAGFVGAPNGKIKQLTVEGMAINKDGAVTGTEGAQGFVRSPSGKVVSFNGPNDPNTTIPTSINKSGDVAGYSETICGIAYGFERDKQGQVSAVGPTDSYYTWVTGINDKGAIAGYYYYSGYQGFVRDASGTYTTFSVTGGTNGTYPQAINTKGEVAGGYRDANNMLHGFVGTP